MCINKFSLLMKIKVKIFFDKENNVYDLIIISVYFKYWKEKYYKCINVIDILRIFVNIIVLENLECIIVLFY